MLAIFLCYFVTLSIYPGVLTDLVSPRFGTWMPVLVMTVFNLFDLIGKVMRTFSIIENLSLEDKRLEENIDIFTCQALHESCTW
jgi:hypothetical protein